MDGIQRLRSHVDVLASQIGDRNVFRPNAFREAGDYISRAFVEAGFEPQPHTFRAQGVWSRNIEAALTGAVTPDEIVLIGAHYDSVRGCPGANDNASGVAAVLELARRLSGTAFRRTVRFVAFANEEPPFFMSEEMGSLVYARRARKNGDRVVGMLSIETIAYFSDERGSQQDPGGLDSLYPDTGNFIGMVANEASSTLLARAHEAFKRATRLPVEAAAAPELLPGVGWSDHWSFWQVGYEALMVTDTAPFRYPWYHTAQDTPDKLDFPRFAQVVDGLEHVVRALADGA